MASDREFLADKLSECGYEGMSPRETADALLAAGMRPPVHTIEAAHELSALPDLSVVVHFPTGYSWQRSGLTWFSCRGLLDSRDLFQKPGHLVLIYTPEPT